MTDLKYSESKRFSVEIETRPTIPGAWGWTRGVLKNVSTGEIITTIDRKYPNFHHSFFVHNGQEWFYSGEHYYHQTIINLETGETYKNQLGNWCWTDVKAAFHGNILVVTGCYWGDSYEYRFFDFSHPEKGWPEIDIGVNLEDDGELVWISSDTVEYKWYTKVFKHPDGLRQEDFYTDDEKFDQLEKHPEWYEKTIREHYHITFENGDKITGKVRKFITTDYSTWITTVHE
jgi:hypothetical protein